MTPLALAALLLLAACGSDPTSVDVGAPSSTTTTTAAPARCSTSGLRVTLVEQDLPPKVAAKRKAIFDAAVACDYDALAAEGGHDFSYTFGEATGAAAHWRTQEEAGEVQPMRMLVQLLNLPFAERHEGDLSYRSWPSADQEHRTAADWDAIRGLYDDETVDQFQRDDMYVGYRTGIRDDGTWMYFLAGD